MLFLLIVGVLLMQGCEFEEQLAEEINKPFQAFRALPDVDTFLDQHIQNIKPTGVLIIRKNDKAIMAVKENPMLKPLAIAVIHYKNLPQNQCQKVQAYAEKQNKLVRCDFDAETGQHIIKMTTFDRELWQSLTQRLQVM